MSICIAVISAHAKKPSKNPFQTAFCNSSVYIVAAYRAAQLVNPLALVVLGRAFLPLLPHRLPSHLQHLRLYPRWPSLVG